MKHSIVNCVMAFIFMTLSCFFDTFIYGEENVTISQTTSSQVQVPYGSEFNDPRIESLQANAKEEYENYTFWGYWRNMTASIVFGDVIEDVTDVYTVRYNRWYPLVGQLLRGYEIKYIDGRIISMVDITGCTMYRESTTSPWLPDYTSLDKDTIVAIQTLRKSK